MKKLIIGLVIGFILGSLTATVLANPSYIGSNAIWNRVFNSTSNTIKVIGQ